MNARHGALALLAVSVLAGVATGAFPLAGVGPPLVLAAPAIAVAYGAAGATSLAVLDRDAPIVRPVLAAAAALLALLLAVWLVASPLLDPTLSLAATVPLATLTVAFAFPLGLATERRHQRIAVGLASLAVTPLLVVVWRLGTETPTDDPAVLFYLSIPLGLLSLGVALPLYLEGRAVTKAVTGRTPSPIPPRAVAVALTGVLVLATAHALRLEGSLSIGTTAGPFSVLRNPVAAAVALLVVLSFVGSALRLGRALSGSGAEG